jgi:hypothetical protein
MRNIDPFCIQKALDGVAGKEKNASRVKKGTLQFGVQNNKQTEVLLEVNVLGSYPFNIETHKSLDSFREVVNSDKLDGMSDKQIQSVPKAYR